MQPFYVAQTQKLFTVPTFIEAAGFQAAYFRLYVYSQLYASWLSFQNEEYKRFSSSKSIVSLLDIDGP